MGLEVGLCGEGNSERMDGGTRREDSFGHGREGKGRERGEEKRRERKDVRTGERVKDYTEE